MTKARGAATELLISDITYVYNSANQLILEFLTGNETNGMIVEYVYDANGNQIQRRSTVGLATLSQTNMTYDLFNRNTSTTVSKPDDQGVLQDVTANTYGYRGDKWHRASMNGTRFLYDGDNVVADLASDGTLQKSYVTPGLDQNLSITDHTDATAVTYYYNADERQSIRNLTDSTGNIAATYEYTAFGESTSQIINPQSSFIDQRYQFTGRELISNNDYYFRYRMYGAGLGGFLSRDPLGYVDGMNVYSGYFAMRLAMDPFGKISSVGCHYLACSKFPQKPAAMARKRCDCFCVAGAADCAGKCMKCQQKTVIASACACTCRAFGEAYKVCIKACKGL